MKMIPWTRVLILASSLSLSIACSDGGGSDSDEPAAPVAPVTTTPNGDSSGTNGTGTAVTGGDSSGNGSGSGTPSGSGTTTSDNAPAAALSCEDSWIAYVKARPVGFVVAYTINSQTTNVDGTVIPSANSAYEDVVLASNDSHVQSKHTVSVQGLAQPISTNVDIKKDQWISTCKKGSDQIAGLPTAPSDVSVEILENGTQSIIVTAGTFATNHIKGKTSDASGESATNFESWTLQDGSGILVKAVTETASTLGGVSATNKVTIELIKLSRP